MVSGKLLIIGAGGQAKVAIDAMSKAGPSLEIVVTDDDQSKQGQTVLGYRVTARPTMMPEDFTAFHVAIGHNAAREQISERLLGQGLINSAICHPQACIARTATVGEGVFVAALAVVGPDTIIARGCIINHGAVVDHDCRIEAFAHIAPGATLGGGVHVGKRVLIGAGANVLPGVSIGDDCVVGAGAVVLSNLEPGSVNIGVPARELKSET